MMGSDSRLISITIPLALMASNKVHESIGLFMCTAELFVITIVPLPPFVFLITLRPRSSPWTGR